MSEVPRTDGEKAARQGHVTSPWLARVGIALWLGAVAFCVQFALASAAELELQAAVMGWMLVLILLAGGASVLGARRLDRGDRE